MRKLKSTEASASAAALSPTRRSALAGFLASGALLTAALALFSGVFIGGEPALTPPKEDVLEKLAEHKRQMMRRYARPVERPEEASSYRVSVGTRERHQQPPLPPQDHDVFKEAKPIDASEASALAMRMPDAEVARAIAQIDTGNIPEALQILTTIIKADPNNEQALVELAMVYLLDLKDPAQATSYLQRVIQVNPGNQVVMSELVGLYEEQGRMDEGMRYLQEVAQQHPNSTEISYGLGQLLAMQGRDADAIPYLERAAAGGADQIRAYRDLAESYSRMGESERALETYSKAITSLEKDIKEKRAQGIPVQYVEEKLNYTKLDKVREMISIGEADQAQELLDEVSSDMAPGNESVQVLREQLSRQRAG